MAKFTQVIFFFFNDTATTEIYTLSLHDALPILGNEGAVIYNHSEDQCTWKKDFFGNAEGTRLLRDRKSTRLNSSHSQISYAVFCLKKKKILKIKQVSKTEINSLIERATVKQ